MTRAQIAALLDDYAGCVREEYERDQTDAPDIGHAVNATIRARATLNSALDAVVPDETTVNLQLSVNAALARRIDALTREVAALREQIEAAHV